MTRLLLAALVALALLAGLVTLFTSSPATEASIANPEPEAAVPEALPQAPASIAEPGPADPVASEVGAEPAAVERAAVETRADVPEVARAPADRRVEGRIVFELDGARLEHETATALILAKAGRRGMSHRVEVVDGRFGFAPSEFLEGEVEHVELKSADLHGQAFLSAGEPEYVDGDGWVFTARALARTALRVLSKETGADLLDVELYDASGSVLLFFRGGQHVHPQSLSERPRRILGPVDSPFDLRVTSSSINLGKLELIAGAPGYAWKTASIPMRVEEPLEQVIELGPAGSLDLIVTGAIPDAGLSLRLRGEQGMAFEQPLRGDLELHLDGLAPGQWTARAERGQFWDASTVSEVAFEIVAGASTSTALEVEAPDPVSTFPVQIELELAAAWELAEVGWRLVRIGGARFQERGQSDLVADGGAVLRNATPIEQTLEAGEYGFLVGEVGSLTFFHVDRDGPIRISVPDPIPFEVEVVPAGEAVPLDGLVVSWNPADVSRLRSYSSKTLERVEGTDRFRGRSAPGAILVRGSNGDAFAPREAFVVSETSNRFQIEAARFAQATIRLLSEGAPVNSGNALYVKAEDLDGAIIGMASFGQSAEGVLRLDTSGRFRFVAPEIDGYLAPEPIERSVAAGEVFTLDFHYTRKF